MPTKNDTVVSLSATCHCHLAVHTLELSRSSFPLQLTICHCDSCRHATGSLTMTTLSIPDWIPSPTLLSKLSSFPFSKRTTFFFCPKCGCDVIFRIKDDDKEEWIVASGTVQNIEGLVGSVAHEFLEDTRDGGLADWIGRYAGTKVERWPRALGIGREVDAVSSVIKRGEIDQVVEGRCKCGNVRFWVQRPDGEEEEVERYWRSGRKFKAGLCVCDDCRLTSGMEVLAWMSVPMHYIVTDLQSNKKLDSSSLETWNALQTYESTAGVRRYFCKSCGASIFWEAEDKGDVLDVFIGVLDADEGVRGETWCEWKADLNYADSGRKRHPSFVKALSEGIGEQFRRENEHVSAST